MNSRIFIKFKIQNIKLNRYLCTKQSANNKKYGINYQHKVKHHFSGILLSKSFIEKYSQCSSIQLNFQNRNFSSTPSLLLSTLDPTKIETIVDLPENSWSEVLKNFSESKIVECAQNILLKVHEVTGLPWWASIALTAFMMRTIITLPFAVVQTRNTAKLQLIRPELEEFVKNCKKEASLAVSYHGWTESMAKQKYQKDVRAEYSKLIVDYNCHPFKSYILLFIQLPIWFSFSFATRNLSYMIPRDDPISTLTYLEMTTGGFGWIKNLTDVDHTLILPIAFTLLNLFLIETHSLFRDPTTVTRLQRIQRGFFRFISILMFPVSMCAPSGTLIYWITSSSFGLLQTFLFHSRRFQQLIGVLSMNDQPKHPYRLFYNNLKSKLHLTKNLKNQ